MLNKTISNITLVMSISKQNTEHVVHYPKSCYVTWTCWHK